MSRIGLELVNERTVYFTGNTFSYKDLIKAVPGSRWEKRHRRWEIPVDSVPDARRILPSIDISESVLKVWKEIELLQQKAIAAKNDDSKAITTIKGLKGTLRTYQGRGVRFLNYLRESEGGILGFDMGTGKSLTALAYFLDQKSKGTVDHLLVICPAPLKYATWEKEVKKWSDLAYTVIDGDRREEVEWEDGTKERLTGQRLRTVQYQQYLFGTDVLIMNYELFLRDFDLIPELDERWMVVLDEAHRIKNPRAQTTKNLFKKVKPAGRKVLATGTPLENNIEEIWSLADLCRPGILGQNYFKFVERYMEKDFFGKVIGPKPQMMPELKKKLEPLMIRVTKEEALPELPPVTVQEYWVEMTNEQKKLYREIKEGILMNEETGEFNYLEVIVQITRLQQLLDSPALLKEVMGNPYLPEESGKLNELRNIIEDIDPSRNKFILFSQYREMTDLLYRWLIDNRILEKDKIGYVRGGLKPSETECIRKAFQEGDMQCVLMTTAGNYGLDLYKASYVICYDQLFNPQKMEQIISRAHRNGNVTGVTAIHLLTKDSYEERKMRILEAKREIFKAVVDDDDAAFARLFTKEELLEMI